LIACLTWLSNVVQFVKCVSGSQPLAPGELHPARKLRRAAVRPRALLRHPLILDGFHPPSPPALTRVGLRRTSACTFYPVFKEPTSFRALPLQLFRRQGNLPILLSAPPSVNPLPLTGEPHRSRWRFALRRLGIELKAVTAT
jgi:hypothetical protein